MKPVVFCGNSLNVIRSFSADVRQDIGFQLDSLQRGKLPDDWKPFRTVGKGVKEIRVKTSGQYRILIVDSRPDAIFVLHCFEKKSRKTRKADIELVRKRLRELEIRID